MAGGEADAREEPGGKGIRIPHVQWEPTGGFYAWAVTCPEVHFIKSVCGRPNGLLWVGGHSQEASHCLHIMTASSAETDTWAVTREIAQKGNGTEPGGRCESWCVPPYS